MKQFITLVLLALSAFCCTPHQAPSPTTPTKADPPVQVRVWREFDLTLHADTQFTDGGRAFIVEAANRWRSFTKGRVRIRVDFDLDFNSIENLKQHNGARDSLLMGVTSDGPIVAELDKLFGGPLTRPLAATAMAEGEPTLVFLIMDRIDPHLFLSVVTHEFGHVAGLRDLPTAGSIMSGVSRRGEAPLVWFTADDLMLCRAANYCD